MTHRRMPRPEVWTDGPLKKAAPCRPVAPGRPDQPALNEIVSQKYSRFGRARYARQQRRPHGSVGGPSQRVKNGGIYFGGSSLGFGFGLAAGCGLGGGCFCWS
jgi:hypothetical protein